MAERLWALRADRTLPPGFFIFKDSEEMDFLNWPNRSGRTDPGVDSASNRNEYQESLIWRLKFAKPLLRMVSTKPFPQIQYSN
jgi:hypothetical protein